MHNPLLGWLLMWMGVVLLDLLLIGVYLALSYRLNRQSNLIYASIQASRAPTTVGAAPPLPFTTPSVRTAGARNPRQPGGSARPRQALRCDPARRQPVRSG